MRTERRNSKNSGHSKYTAQRQRPLPMTLRIVVIGIRTSRANFNGRRTGSFVLDVLSLDTPIPLSFTRRQMFDFFATAIAVILSEEVHVACRRLKPINSAI
jgi:hypothetical protein